MRNQLTELRNKIREDVARECEEYSSIDAERIKKQIEKRPGKYESIDGFYVVEDLLCGPMYLMQRSHIEHSVGKVIDWPFKTLFHSPGNMTLFLYQKRAMEAIRDTKKIIKKCGLIPLSEPKITSTKEAGLIYHFLDDNSRVWLPTSDLIEICDELPQKRWFRIQV